MEGQSQLDDHIVGIKRDINGLILQLERLRRGEMERDILHQINHKHEIIQALQRDQQERNFLRQINHKNEAIHALRIPVSKAMLPSSVASSDATFSLTSSSVTPTSTDPTSFNSSQDSVDALDDSFLIELEGSDHEVPTTPHSTSLPSFSTFLKPASPSPSPRLNTPVEPGTCPLCGRRCSLGNMWRHRKTCLGRCLDCTRSQTVCDDRGRGAPSHDCKTCQDKCTPCLYLDKGDGKWKPKIEFAHITRFTRLARLARSREEIRKEEEGRMYGGG
ncbi:hypothetical protein FKW77_000847 [Venturia effusa]|uniref:Uncharacterized protein n=1 Tax=Venturia effusa TaxID=50376 RepID=A0A517KYZ0_9PEZI|nr:hypothetical protein FKW77_000847 [Venturia effusa]